jgi:hypothetical protein
MRARWLVCRPLLQVVADYPRLSAVHGAVAQVTGERQGRNILDLAIRR